MNIEWDGSREDLVEYILHETGLGWTDDTWELVQTIVDALPWQDEPVCTCGSEDGQHLVTCRRYYDTEWTWVPIDEYNRQDDDEVVYQAIERVRGRPVETALVNEELL